MFFKKKKLKAAAIKYSNEKLDTPVISAIGNGEFAREIIRLAKENSINIMKNENFFDFENLFEVGKEIPFEVYKIVADILVEIMKTNIEEAGNG